MKEIVNELKELYLKRDVKGISQFVDKWVSLDPELIISGTCSGEVMKGKKGLTDILKGDFKYWYDLVIDENCQYQEYLGYEIYHINAISKMKVNETNKHYRDYMDEYDQIIKSASITAYQKATCINYWLSSLLSTRKNKRRVDDKPLDIVIVLKNDKMIYINYHFVKTLDTADTFFNMFEELDRYYAHELKQMRDEHVPQVEEYLTKLGYTNIKANYVDEHYVYGTCVMEIKQTLDERLNELFANYKKADAYLSLYQLRLQIAYLLNAYALNKNPKAIIKFYGFIDDMSTIEVSYPLYSYIESK